MELAYDFINKLKKLDFVEEIYLFGSRAQNTAAEKSDIDLAISCPKASPKEWQMILDIIENADTLLQIDCIRYDAILDTEFKKEIDRTKKIIYAK